MKILLVQLKRIGDLILTTPAIRCLREEIPGVHLTLIADASCRSLLPALDVDDGLIYDRAGGNSGLWTALPRVRADWCLDFSGTDRAAFFCALSRSRRRVNFSRFQKRFLRKFVFTDFVESSVRDRHTADHYTDLLRPLGVGRENVPSGLRLPEDAAFDSWLAGRGVAGPYAVIHAGTARPEKYWVPERWAAVAKTLQVDHGLLPVLTGSDAPEEQAHLRSVREQFGGACVDLSGTSDLTGLARIIRGARIFCGVDTAAMHLADAVGTPAVALFGPTNPYQWRPRHTRSVVLRADTDEPFTVRQKGGPMEHIAVDSVRRALLGVLG